jgi:hypothetical protein
MKEMKKLEVIKEELLFQETEVKEKPLRNTEAYLRKYTEFYKEKFGEGPIEVFKSKSK